VFKKKRARSGGRERREEVDVEKMKVRKRGEIF
jgi:hypothetical protein